MDYTQRLVWETEGYHGAAERGWLGQDAQELEEERQRYLYEQHLLQQTENE